MFTLSTKHGEDIIHNMKYADDISYREKGDTLCAAESTIYKHAAVAIFSKIGDSQGVDDIELNVIRAVLGQNYGRAGHHCCSWAVRTGHFASHIHTRFNDECASEISQAQSVRSSFLDRLNTLGLPLDTLGTNPTSLNKGAAAALESFMSNTKAYFPDVGTDIPNTGNLSLDALPPLHKMDVLPSFDRMEPYMLNSLTEVEVAINERLRDHQ
ncbi:hypothetical protein FSARC_6975 [Fusarium sarcochroum]|uniref:Uncharacterized protein n=1 Tax=Fusarium sarcochroum TaxID=1208366 RepID=A0A8H4TWE3_9HYPO|nr:hypothetical protein FSARC_6975 [Fusarium sarcochroum]